MTQTAHPLASAYMTSSIPYVNGQPHVGHALEYVQADTFARYRQQIGQPTRLQTGSDDNSLKNVLAAERAGTPVATFVERNVALFRGLADLLDVGYDGFIRTGDNPSHRAGVSALWRACDAAGAIYRRSYRGLYCVGCEAFYTADELTETGLCPEHLAPPDAVEEDNYFFRLSRYGPALRDAIESGRLRIVPESRRNETLAFIDRGLEDFSISRAAERARGWAIPVPGDSAQVVYVWFDALCNYITALGYGGDDDGLYRQFWTEAGERLHTIGKGILRFHTVYWPAMLLAAGLPLPTTVFVHGYLTVEGQKIGKSLGNAVDPRELIDRYGGDALRWYLLREIHPTADGDVSTARLVARYNTDLGNGLGNLLNRANSMLHRYRSGVVPAPPPHATPIPELAALCEGLPARVAAALGAYDPRAALDTVWELVVRCNRLVDEAAPWTLYKAERAGDDAADAARGQLDAVLYALLESVRLVAMHLEPFLPAASTRIQAQLGVNHREDATRPYHERVRWGGLVPGTRTEPPEPLFPRLEASAED